MPRACKDPHTPSPPDSRGRVILLGFMAPPQMPLTDVQTEVFRDGLSILISCTLYTVFSTGNLLSLDRALQVSQPSIKTSSSSTLLSGLCSSTLRVPVKPKLLPAPNGWDFERAFRRFQELAADSLPSQIHVSPLLAAHRALDGTFILPPCTLPVQTLRPWLGRMPSE